MKSLQWMAKLLLSAWITSVVCIASTFWAVSTYADMIMEQYNLKSSTSAMPTWPQFVGQLGKQLGFGGGSPSGQGRTALGDKQGAQPQPDRPVLGSVADSSSVAGAGNQAGAGDPSVGAETGAGTGGAAPGGGSGSNGGSSTTKKPPEDAVAVFGHQSGGDSSTPEAGAGTGGGISPGAVAGAGSGAGSSAAEDSKRIVVSGEEFTKKKDQLSSADKNKIFNLLVSRVPQADMQTISGLMEDGITASELKEIEEILQKYLKPDEYAQLIAMIKAN
ncbi:hypothetical protein SK3146_03776 [Paenibacillus konkukensis]|uniref:Spore coat protein n=2 Tax=Paenibacillus konkukensis TaxID=2020716 RepID=A0ABY4RSG2_9BACL|nr:hypothetical protein SK3146_03776 [Paenibacillus konkukensis]